jgi:hypothetical protein
MKMQMAIVRRGRVQHLGTEIKSSKTNIGSVKTLNLTVRILADLPRSCRALKAVALKLCQDISNILAKYDGAKGGAQVIPAPRNIKVATMPDD